MKGVFVIAVLWVIPIAVTLLLVEDKAIFSLLGPVYAICMIGSIVTVRRVQGQATP